MNESDDMIVRTIPLPICVKGVTVPHPDGTYNIYINANYSSEIQKDILKHELRHIYNDDFENFDDIDVCEDRANQK